MYDEKANDRLSSAMRNIVIIALVAALIVGVAAGVALTEYLQ